MMDEVHKVAEEENTGGASYRFNDRVTSSTDEKTNRMNDDVTEKMSRETSAKSSGEEDNEPERLRKLFVGGLDSKSSEETLKSHFEQWGEIVHCIVVRDARTKRSKGYGFVTYKKSHMVDDVQTARPHRIDGREMETRRAVPKEESGKPEAQIKSKKLYVGQLLDDVEEQDLRECFGKYGPIVGVSIVTDKTTGKRRGYAFLEFSDHDAVDKAVLVRQHMLKGNRVQARKGLSRKEKEICLAKKEKDNPKVNVMESRGGAAANGFGSSFGVPSPWINANVAACVNSVYPGLVYFPGVWGANYGSNNGGGPIGSFANSQRSQGPYGRGDR